MLLSVVRVVFLQFGEVIGHIFLDAGGDISAVVGFLEFFAGDVLVELDVTVGNGVDNGVGHLGHFLAFLALEAVIHKPLADELFAELALMLALGETLLIAVGIEIAAAVGSVYFIDEVYLAVALAKLILCVDKDEPMLSGDFGAALEEGKCVSLELVVVFLGYEAGADDLLAADILVVSFVGLGGGGDDGCGELLILDHAFGQLDAAEGACASLIFAPGAASEVAAHNHLDTEAFTFEAHGDHGVGSGKFPIGEDVGGGIEELSGNLVEDLSLVGDALGENDVESRDAVGDHHGHIFVVDVIYIANLAYIEAFLLGKTEVCFNYCVHITFFCFCFPTLQCGVIEGYSLQEIIVLFYSSSLFAKKVKFTLP